VIVVGPSLSNHRCGLPREIAIELGPLTFFVIRGLIRQHLASNIGVAKKESNSRKRAGRSYAGASCIAE
jgi:DNA-directed RNA polymerase subunit beta'